MSSVDYPSGMVCMHPEHRGQQCQRAKECGTKICVRCRHFGMPLTKKQVKTEKYNNRMRQRAEGGKR